jgi:putative FmdB family regulatory protein
MPTYDYVCQACDHAFEEFQAITAKPLKKCPDCGKLKLQRLIGTGAGVIFKGSGFYETDYRGGDYDKAKKAEADAGKPKEGKDKKDGKAGSDSTSGTKDSSKKTETGSGSSSAEPAGRSSTESGKGASKSKG